MHGLSSRSNGSLSCLLLAPLLAVTATGCAWWGSSRLVRKDLAESQAVFSTADLRAIIETRRGVTEPGEWPRHVVCAEPSPDVAKAMADSLSWSGDVNIHLPPNAATPEVAAAATSALSRSRSEALAQLTQRLATIQLLRDGLYRACEAYANGAISDTTYAVLLSRYDDTMITMLLGEFAAGAPARSGAAISTSSSGESSAPPAQAPAGQPAAAAAGAAAPGSEAPAGPPSAASRASATASAGGDEAGGSPNEKIAVELAEMQRKYVENINIDALMVACIHTLADAKTAQGPLSTLCLEQIPLMLGSARELLVEYKKRGAEARAAIAQWKTVQAGLASTAKLVEQVKKLEGKSGGR